MYLVGLYIYILQDDTRSLKYQVYKISCGRSYHVYDIATIFGVQYSDTFSINHASDHGELMLH